MSITLLHCQYEIAFLGVELVISFQTAWFFGSLQNFRKLAPINISALVASILGLRLVAVRILFMTYFKYSIPLLFRFHSNAVYKLGYWFTGLGSFYTCERVMIMTGLISASNAAAFLHLFLRANAINELNPRWPFLRIIGFTFILANWIVLLGVVLDRKNDLVSGPDGDRCRLNANDTYLILKYILQLVNQIMQSGLFIWPLISYVRSLDTTEVSEIQSVHGSLYRHVAKKAIIAMIVSALVTVIVTVLVIYFLQIDAPTSALSILDNAVTLGSIYFANDVDMTDRYPIQTPRIHGPKKDTNITGVMC